MKLFLMGSLMVLTGCANSGGDVRALRVEVPVLIPCKIQKVSVPAWAAIGLKKADSLESKVRALLSERRQRIAYERELVATVNSCQ